MVGATEERMKREAKDEEWARLLERRRWTASDAMWALDQWAASGGAITRFARAHGIDANRLIRWRARLEWRRPAEGATAPMLVPVTVLAATAAEPARDAREAAVVVVAGQVRVEVRELSAASRSWVAQLLGLESGS
jgi:Transposase